MKNKKTKYLLIAVCIFTLNCSKNDDPIPKEYPRTPLAPDMKKDIVNEEDLESNDPIPKEVPGFDSTSQHFVLKSPQNNWTNINKNTIFEFTIKLSEQLSADDAYKYISEPGDYISLNNYKLKVENYKLYDNSIHIEYVINSSSNIEEGPYELSIDLLNGSEAKFKFRSDSNLHVSGVLFDMPDKNTGETTVDIILSEEVKIDDKNYICINDRCLDNSYVGQVRESFKIDMIVDINDPLQIRIDRRLKSDLSGETITERPWQSTAAYKHIATETDYLIVDYYDGIAPFECNEGVYCWGFFLPM